MKEEWTDKLKTRLEHHEMTPPAGLWEGISKQMNLAEKPVRKSSSALSKRWLAAAAALLALAGFFTLYDFKNDATSDTPKNIAEKVETTQVPAREQTPEEKPADEVTAKHRDNFLLAQAKPSIRKATSPVADEPTPDVLKADAKDKEEITVDTKNKEEYSEARHQASEPTSEEAQTLKNTPRGNTPLPPSRGEQKTAPHLTASQSAGQWSFGLHASGGLLAANSQQPNYPADAYMNDPLFPSSSSQYNSDADNPQKESQLKAKHHLPIRFGLKVGYQLSDRWALQSGITYTYLYSEFTSDNSKQRAIEQKLHYVGIPLGISYRIWKSSTFRLYASAGAAAEICVNNSQKNADSSFRQQHGEKPLQWSVNAALGAEYQPTKQLGIYLEPSLGYYFKDNTLLEHFYKEHPLSPSIEFGLRLHLNGR